MWKEHSTASEADRPTTAGWALWVTGWGLLVGSLGAVVPAFFLFGSRAALWTGASVLLAVGLITWLGAEAARAVSEDRRRSLLPPEEYAGAKRVPTMH